ncbi:unnamed protein product [Schistocephalus solidus]|uniref:Uncharacterized protein n=1 Tax=Schistocephalus solidus TaxID=70667 RepID=A0A183T2E1_SCHSO|nr:unnamed protein product [Schistocephalus solidus]
MSLWVLADMEVKIDATRTLKKSLKQLEINLAIWADLAQDRRAWRRSMKTSAAIYEANRIADAKAKRRLASHKPRGSTPPTSNVPTLSTHVPRAIRPGRTSSNSMQQQSHNLNFYHTCRGPHDDDHPIQSGKRK